MFGKKDQSFDDTKIVNHVPWVIRHFLEQFALAFVSGPLRNTVWDFHDALTVKDMCGGLELEWDRVLREVE